MEFSRGVGEWVVGIQDACAGVNLLRCLARF